MMRRKYEAPEILFEDFSISTSIAGNCEHIIGNQSRGTCGLTGFGPKPIFTSDFPTACKKEVVDGGATGLDGLCYHIPSSDYNIFNS